MIRKVIYTIEKNHMIKDGDMISVGLSGGADSICLLLILLSLKEKYNLNIDAIHINHCIRNSESDRDEEFCRMLCKKLSVPFTAIRIDVPAYAKENNLSMEEAARNIRYNEFSKHTANIRKLATAHTASDNAETVIFNLARGATLKGLTGIPPVRDNIIRPLINNTRNEIEAYLELNNQSYVTDSTNLSDDYTRNRIRHRIIPELININSGFYKTFSSNCEIINEENRYIANCAGEAYNKCLTDKKELSGLTAYPAVIRRRCIAKFLKSEALPYSLDKIISIDKLIFKDGKINIIKNVYIVSNQGILFVERAFNHKKQDIFKSFCPKEGNNFLYPNKACTIMLTEAISETTSNSTCIDYDKICGNLNLHSRKYGDKINLSNRNFTSSVKKLLNENIEPNSRPYIHFISDDNGLIYIEGIGIADRVKPDSSTKKFIVINIKDVI